MPSPRLCLLAFAGALATLSPAQIPGVTREQMWRAPTEEEWKRPVLITFQRTWDDALAVSKETGKPILICVNMDGEIASEHYAGVRYREPDIASIYEPYVCVIASVYRHNPRDHEENGDRIICPRFGSVTCGEHISIEPLLYERYFEGERVAPRHIGVELDKKEMYDVYYAFDTDSVFAAIAKGVEGRPAVRPVERGDRDIYERVKSADIADREAVEGAYRDGDQATRRGLLVAALQAPPGTAPHGLIRMAVFGLDLELARLARQALANATSPRAVDLINEALRAPMPAEEREALIAALTRLGEQSERARTLAVVHRGLGTRSDQVDVEEWSRAIRGGATYAAPTDWTALESRVEKKIAASGDKPADPAVQLELAESSLALAGDPKTNEILGADSRTASKYTRLMFQDAERAALRAESLGASGWRLHATIGLASYYLGNVEEAYRRAELAMPDIPAGATDWSAISTIALFAQARQQAVLDAVKEKKEWPGAWLTDVNAAYSVLASHPLGTDRHFAAHYDFLNMLGAAGRAAEVLMAGLKRFPESWALHDCLRSRILRDKGVAGLEPAYEKMLLQPGASPNLSWFAGYTSIVVGEYCRRRGQNADGRAAYTRAVAHYEASVAANPKNAESADHYIALALAGRARLAAVSGDYQIALDDLIASFDRRPQSVATLDGLNLSGAATAKMLRARLKRHNLPDLAARLDAAMSKLDPALFDLPAFERGGPRRPQTRQRRRGR